MSRHELIVVKRGELLNMKLCPHGNMKSNACLGVLVRGEDAWFPVRLPSRQVPDFPRPR